MLRLSREQLARSIEVVFEIDRAPHAALAEDTRRTFGPDVGKLGVDETFVSGLASFADELEAPLATALPRLVPCSAAGADDAACLTTLLDERIAFLYRHPLTETERAHLTKLFTDRRADGDDRLAALVAVCQAAVLSPSFVFRTELGEAGGGAAGARALTGPEAAAALAFDLWGEPPPRELLADAFAGRLAAPDAIRARAARMIDDPRAQRHFRRFLAEWLDLDDLAELPGADAALGAELMEETGRLFDEELWAGKGAGAYVALHTTTTSFVTPALAKIYGLPAPAGSAAARVTLPAGERAGLLARAGFVRAQRTGHGMRPIHIGHTVVTRLLCSELGDPPPDAADVGNDPALTERQQEMLRLEKAQCAGCHMLLDRAGYAFRSYDETGRYLGRKTEDADLAVVTGLGDGLDGPVDDPVALSAKLSKSPTARACFARQLAAFASAGVLADAAAPIPAAAAFERQSLKDVVAAIVASDAFVLRDPSGLTR